jgi:hypothetical protein
MTDLIACLSTGKGTWIPVIKLINSENWEKIFLIAPGFATEKFSVDKPVEFIIVDPDKPLKELHRAVFEGLSQKLTGIEVALNLSSGTGKEHMAIISALLKQGVGIRLVSVNENGVTEEI